VLTLIGRELKRHAPFTALGTLVGTAALVAVGLAPVPRETSEALFGLFHPVHVLFSAIVTAGIYRLHSEKGRWWAALLIGYVGSIGVGTLSDCLIPYLGEALFELHQHAHVHAEAHIGFIDPHLWMIVNPLAILGSVIGLVWAKTRIPHAAHVLLSTAASLFHMTMALEHGLAVWVFLAAPVFLFLAVWVPCCTSDIIFPLLFVSKGRRPDMARCMHGCRDASEPADEAPDP